jgi:hypothetical protein
MNERMLLQCALAIGVVPRIAVAFLDRPYHDEWFYVLIASYWLEGSPPYLAIWDLKPPGLFALYAGVLALGAGPREAIALLPILATVAATIGVATLGREWFGAPRAGAFAACLFALFALTVEGLRGPAVLLAAPFVVWALRFAILPRARDAMLAGALSACVCLVLQSSAFEALLAFGLTLLAGSSLRERVSRLVAFAFGAAGPAFALAAILFAQNALGAAVEAVVSVALARSAFHPVGFWEGIVVNLPMRLEPYLPLLAMAFLACVWRLRALDRSHVLVLVWLGLTLFGAILQRSAHAAYVMPLIAPLSLLAGLWLSQTGQRVRRASSAVTLCFALYWSTNEILVRYYVRVIAETAQALNALAQTPGESEGLHVVDYDASLYVLTGMRPVTRFAFFTHLTCAFPLPRGVDRMAEIRAAMARAPRFVVKRGEDPFLGTCLLPEVSAYYAQVLGEYYRHVGTFGRKGESRIFELREGMAPRLRSR